ncbi:MAG TPA: hypothetical protein VE987_08665 [Polyangiaceae bacterium]|nr:hypothetical protein [Polyangiaceae bacterium]
MLALRLLALARAVAPALALLACGGAQSEPASAAARDASSIQARLVAGPWRLVGYRPEVPLEPMLAMLLTQQLQTMTVRFDGRTLSAQSPTIQISRPYVLQNVGGLTFDLVSPDFQGGGTLSSHCQMSDDGRHVQFHADTDPWRGAGTLEREGP